MNTTFAKTIARIALPIVSAGLIGGAALGMAGVANATTSTQPTGPGYSYAPTVKAHPAPSAPTGLHGYARSQYLQNANNG
jgi:ABC-type phosphate transport system permease subunit